PQERIAHVVWEREEAKRQASEARRQADELRYQLEQARRSQVQATPQPPAQGQPQNRQPADPDAPRPDQFERYEDFVMANAQFAADKRVRQELARLQSEAQAQQLEQMRSSRAQQFSDRVKAAEANDPEFLTKVSPEVLNLRPAMNLQPGETPDGGTAVADYLVELDDPRPMMLHLSEHPEEFRRITALHPMFAMRELGRLDARLYAAPTGPASVSPAVSRAKPPIRPVGAGSQAPTAHRDPSRMNSLAEYRAWRAANPTS
ncbi:MAG: hypothetical protein VW405_00975, partial [Rhodospirillaceae bacterium]